MILADSIPLLMSREFDLNSATSLTLVPTPRLQTQFPKPNYFFSSVFPFHFLD